MWAVVPIKHLGAAKQRLADALARPDRRRLTLAMADDVLAALSGVPGLAGVAVISGDPEVAALARRYGARHIPEPEARGHTAAVATRRRAVGGRRGARHADLAG